MWRGGLGVEKGLCVSFLGVSFGTAERREVGYMTPHSCNCRRGVCKCVSCLLGCVPVRREEGGLGEKREERPASCAHPSSTTIRRAPPPTKASGCWYALDVLPQWCSSRRERPR